MRRLYRSGDMRALAQGEFVSLPALLLITSSLCPVCHVFMGIYRGVEKRLRGECSTCVVEAERLGGRGIFKILFRKNFQADYSGYPSLFIITERETHEVPYGEVMWSEKRQRFDDEQMSEYIKTYLNERESR